VGIGDVSNDGADRAAGNCFFEPPQELDDGVRADQNERRGVEPESPETEPIGQTEFLGIGFELKDQQPRTFGRKHGLRLGESETESGAGVDGGVGEDLMHIATGRRKKASNGGTSIGVAQSGACFEGRDGLLQRLEFAGLTRRHLLCSCPEQTVNIGLGSRVKPELCGTRASTACEAACLPFPVTGLPHI
jgi:hypothetical protein